MALFSNKELAEVRRQLEDARSEIDRLEKSLANAAKDRDRALQRAKDIEVENEALKKELEAAKAACDAAKESQKKADSAGRWFEERYQQAITKIEGAEKMASEAEAIVKAANSERDIAVSERERLAAENERLKAELGALKVPVQKAEAALKPEGEYSDVELAHLQMENQQLRRENQELLQRARLALRKAEHNRRAYVITQSQLDLAEDRLHLLTKGVPRPVLREYDEDIEKAEEVVAEDVEGFEEEPM
ncbi:MAG TPA: hypothetical protein PK329_04140 [Myxococcota bacterium]|nr:hypothetical protein [Myxococcota bacterium]HON24549.1 hypothetical protein [Myxococcota bacterium]HOS61431.1 hypothetical protein [Myxococcota bacterium]HPC91107.1 hypothetical protein [Myxococcota bacterium]HPL24401.1 hypothetical protein [Myxococcota bacterium]